METVPSQSQYATHFFPNAKGGIGKLHFCVMLAQAMRKAGVPVACFDAVPSNATFLKFGSLRIDCVVTSPPYWRLRDYGTGSWDGGDPDCDHRSPSMREDREEGRALLGGPPSTNGAQLPPHRRSCCGKCGAVRPDEQIGLEPTFKQLKAVFDPRGGGWPEGICLPGVPALIGLTLGKHFRSIGYLPPAGGQEGA